MLSTTPWSEPLRGALVHRHGRRPGAGTAAGRAPRGEDEAMHCDQILGEAWDRAPDAQEWLYDALVEMGLVEEDDLDEDRDQPRSSIN